MVVSINTNSAFSSARNKIRLQITEVLFCTTPGDLKWVTLNYVLLPLFVTMEIILDFKVTTT